MSRIVSFCLSIFSVFVVCGLADCDSIKDFDVNKATFNPALDNINAQSMNRFIDRIAMADILTAPGGAVVISRH